jgi:folylpolyglutamate synthase/dihydropteroate synthase
VTHLDEFLPTVEAGVLRPTFFEVMVAFAFDVFHRRPVNYSVVGTGLGGLLDAAP